MYLSEILGSLKRDHEKEKKVMEHHQTVARPWATMAPQVGGQMFGVYLPIFNFKF